ncbi:uncharacterized protein LOC129770879 [Toxorhynchites rutilus septentrionalis]|uniref:uncharacterized protein LOC129770879 n=1 Tax=Toxorhynchites rutilus septentrionalis TaxID=329112 RepID=UPI00247AF70A|nr:uncharacterized protein LOC129770879 [Toxorhynchites rutilus septentrionalis]XP_055630005.1 uncharacterized protein LOC129770879 [Toxorhynchites rutilus septentrionalis]XP_055630006.1 uncharacterized protein LOC129770879 [Toxorhynchites rutilus septentrionalis]XP_055630007.1 uncharacterized protein LOC129770879 [Toxorhynchites rutilus septentrionalis]XP_055630008.1 uncharacterized protein LOC129770879 [Toxorhynchites rutilus septentrionalis]XP_055630010.1 uncharacterized protein LOC12977087
MREQLRPIVWKFYSTSLFGALLMLLPPNYVMPIETPEPAALLRPRDINPHPYDNAYDGVSIFDKSVIVNSGKLNENLFNQSPIQFPRLVTTAAMNALPHPYEKFALKERLAKTERFSGPDNQIVKPAYRALAKYAARVLNQHAGRQYDDGETDSYNDASDQKKHYVFSYSVKDAASGDDFSHTQQQQVNGAVKGSYKVQLPDGRMQIVKYVADNNGYRADVTYENDHNLNVIKHVNPTQAVVQVPVAAVPVTSPLASAQPIYNYYKNLQQRQQLAHQQATIQQQQLQNPIYYARTTPTQIPAPYYPSRLQVNGVKIHSYNTAPHANSLVQATIPPSSRGYITYQTPANLAYVSSTPNPVQIQSNTLAQAGLVPVVVTTAHPSLVYRDININPTVPSPRRTTIYTPPTPVEQSQPAYDYDYVQIPASNHVYKRNSEKDSQVITSSKQMKPSKLAMK